MTRPNTVKILQVLPVAPPPGTTISTAPTSLPSTYFDIVCLRASPAERLFFYEFPHPTTSFFDSVLPKLKHSLSFTLQHFPPLAGNLVWPHESPKPIIRFVPGDALSLTIAQSDSDLNHISGTNPCEALEHYPLVPHLTTSHEKTSVLAVQITLFPGSGFSIGAVAHHAVLDGKTSTLFLKSWAHICSKLTETSPSSPPPSLPENLIPFFDRAVIRDPKDIGAIYINEWTKHDAANSRSVKLWNWDNKIPHEEIRGTFELTPSDLQKLKESVASELKNKSFPVSKFALTSAYTWACLVKAEQTESNSVTLIFAADCRSRLEPPIPPTYFGNCISVQRVSLETKNLLGNDGFITALEAISENLNGLKAGVLNGAETWLSHVGNQSDKKIRISGSPRFEVYSIDFGWGRPKKVEMTSIAKKVGAFSVEESRHGNGGIEIGLALKKSDMEAFSALFAEGLESI
ncbi:hypothetical protein L6164_007558 [Bauhinia variegata]|uniref:Uncharacterized protein n=1 Tax=Bauhinia variegata TaxID=167791 RepID=A0ACB9PJE9_BAUVA|nr:hypothetical protein L6164_007558 [Bauhinia variegata]